MSEIDNIAGNAAAQAKAQILREIVNKVPEAINSLLNDENRATILDVHQVVSRVLVEIGEREGIDF